MITVCWLILLADMLILTLVIWNVIGWPEPSSDHGPQAPGMCSVLVPARDEASNISACLLSVLSQGDVVGEVIVCDDQSEDGTAEIIETMIRSDPRVHLIGSGGPPPGWCGKPYACALLAAKAQCEWLLFLDADARLCKGGLDRIIAEASRRKLHLLSCWPGLILGGFWETTLMPMLNFVVFTLFPAPLSIIRSADASLGLAHGVCILARRAQYERLGGHGLVRNELFEDTSLARAWRAAGGLALCLDGQHIVRVRMYDSFSNIWSGFIKNFYPAFRHAGMFWLFLLFHAGCFLIPFVALISTRGRGLVLTGAAAACVLLMRFVQARKFGYPLWPLLLHPLAESIFIGVGLRSWWRCRSGKGVTWKGRSYRGGAKPKTEALEMEKDGIHP